VKYYYNLKIAVFYVNIFWPLQHIRHISCSLFFVICTKCRAPKIFIQQQLHQYHLNNIHCYFHCKRNMTPNKRLIYMPSCAHCDCDYLRKIFSIWCVILICCDILWHLLWCRTVTGARGVAVLVTEGSFARSRSCTRTAARSFS